MKNITDKNKRVLLAWGLAVVCIFLIAAISSKLDIKPAQDDATPPSVTVPGDVNPAVSFDGETADEKDEVVVKQADDANETDQSDPPPKPTPLGDTTNPAKPPEYKEEDTTVSKPAEPKAGDKNEKGQVWFPGFGWVNDEGGGTEVNEVGSDGDINKQVGTMD